ncbi:thioredoxin family protein [Aerosakkonemataceae cyanobacterium BLCC-F154]|uniref:Thioredoxin n=1 Tax=Floridaenema fluviatile BLCC-F154 TaxID=3153640 RepID=A0ABV4Y4B2_9CYAN
MSDSTNKIFSAKFQGQKALEQLQQNSENPILVKFVAPHCSACKTLAPVLEQLMTDYQGKIDLVTIDMTEDPEFAIELSVRSAPTVVLFKGNTVLEKIAGLKPKKLYLEAIQKVLIPNPG